MNVEKRDSTPQPTSPRRPRFAIRIEGPRVGEARLSANDLAEIVRRTQQALKRVGQVLYGEASLRKGRKKRDIEELCELFIVGWRPGSAVAELELAEPPAQLSLFGYIGEQSLKAFLQGMDSIRAMRPDSGHSSPRGFDAGVLQVCDALGRVLDHGIDAVRFEPEQGMGLPVAVFDRPVRERVRELLGKPIEQRQVEKVGRLEVLDGHTGLRGRLWEADGTKWLCNFKPEHLELLPGLWLRTVQIVGEAIIEPNRERLLNVKAILPLDDEIVQRWPTEERQSFWAPISLDEMAEQQGVRPAEDLDSISDLWPVDDDPDELLRHVLAERSARRRGGQEGAS
ncbi:MAG TPA: hypothetical protein EYP14_12550 [Planctomycetaceae bacterium]|nr:hypothetical protein [Planctomycetaceae bacterium]